MVDSWDEKFELVRAYVAEYDRLPSNQPPRGLYLWLDYQRAAHKKGRLDATRLAALNAGLPTWRSAPRGRRPFSWQERADALESFIEKSGGFPRALLLDVDATEERTLQLWLGQQRTALRRKTAPWSREREAILDVQIPGWRNRPRPADPNTPQPGSVVWLARVDDLALFVRIQARLPRTNGSLFETGLYLWLAGQREGLRHHKTPWTPERAAILDKKVPTWRKPRGAKPRKKRVVSARVIPGVLDGSIFGD